MGLHHEEANGSRCITLAQMRTVSRKKLIGQNGVSCAFAHSSSVEGKHIAMHPVTNRTIRSNGLALSDFTLVMGEFEVHSAAMYIELVAEVFRAHH